MDTVSITPMQRLLSAIPHDAIEKALREEAYQAAQNEGFLVENSESRIAYEYALAAARAAYDQNILVLIDDVRRNAHAAAKFLYI